jgi:hypothetical protein
LAWCRSSRAGRQRSGQRRQDPTGNPLVHHQCFAGGGGRRSVAQMGAGALVDRESFSLRT